jgi:hypothetical protein
MKIVWPAGILYCGLGLSLIVGALSDVPRSSLLRRWRNQPAVPLTPAWRIGLVTLGCRQIALSLLVAFGIVR